MADLALLKARAQFLSRSDWTPVTANYVVRHGIDMIAVNNHAGLIAVTSCCFCDNGRFAFEAELEDEALEWAVVIEIYGEDDETVVDLCAWPYEHPESFATFLGAEALGLARTCNPATWAYGGALNVFRTPLRWLQAGCQGCVVLDHRNVAGWLGSVSGPIQAEDLAHARQLDKWLNPPRFDKRRIMVPCSAERRAA